jgi:hypothetical protein
MAQAPRRELSDFDRGRIVGAWQLGHSRRDIASALSFPESTVRNVISDPIPDRSARTGRPRKLPARGSASRGGRKQADFPRVQDGEIPNRSGLETTMVSCLLASSGKKKAKVQEYASTKSPYPGANIDSTDNSTMVTADQDSASRAARLPSHLRNIAQSSHSFQFFDGERPNAKVVGDETPWAPDVPEPETSWYPVPDLMYGTMFTSFLEPRYDNAGYLS